MTCASGTLETTLEMISWIFSDLGDVALPSVQLGRDGQVAELGEPAADVLDVLVDAEDLLDDQDDRERSAVGRHGPVGGDLAVGDRDLHLAGLQALGIGRDRLGGDRLRPPAQTRRPATSPQTRVEKSSLGGKLE